MSTVSQVLHTQSIEQSYFTDGLFQAGLEVLEVWEVETVETVERLKSLIK